VYDFEFAYDDLAFIDDEQAAGLSNVEIEPADVLINITGASVARCCLVPENVLPARVNQHVAIIRVLPSEADARYVQYCLASPRYKRHLLGIASGGATRKALTKSTLEDYQIPLPPLPVQRRIAGVLSAYDDLIENNARRIALLEDMAQAVYREWFVELRFPGHADAQMREMEALGAVPAGWEVVTVPEAIEINPRISIPDGEKHYVPMAGIPENSMIVRHTEMRDTRRGRKFQNYDTLFARITPSLENGKTGYVQFMPSDDDVGVGSGELINLRSKTLCPEYVYLLARTEPFRQNAIKSMTGASGRQRVQLDCFDDFRIAQPDKETLAQFERTVRPMFEMVQTLVERNATLRRTRDLLLPRLVSGEVAVGSAEEEVAARVYA
jgi:type I restriction enzyme S subunit